MEMRVYRWLVMVALLLIAAPGVCAQADSGRFSGTVFDGSGNPVAGATVSARNDRTGETRTAVSNDKGYFVIPSLKPAEYSIHASKDGVGIAALPGLPLAVGQELPIDFTLQTAAAQEEVTVVAAATVLDLSTAKIGANVSEREVQGLPVNGRQMSQLLLQAPGSQNAGDGTWQDIRFSGRANEQNVIKYDGIEGSAIVDASPGNANGENKTPFKLQASLENVQEFRVESSGYTAELGTGTGGQVNVVTKSGSNNFHGALFEYLRNDALDARNHFDSLRNNADEVVSEAEKSRLDQHQFGGSIGGPIMKDRAFFFGSYEGYRLRAGRNLVEAAPSAAAWSRAVPAIAALRASWVSPNAVPLPAASTSADLDIYQLQSTQDVDEDSFSGRFDLKMNNNWSMYTRLFHDQGTSREPVSVTGRVQKITGNPTNAVFNMQGLIGDSTINEFKFGYNAAPTTIGAETTPGFENILISLGGTVANAGIAGQGGSTGLASPGGLVRVNSAGNGRAAPYDPYSLTFANSVSRVVGSHYIKIGADVRLIRMTTDQQGGITYTYQNLAGFLANTPQQVQYFGDLSEASPFNNGASGDRHTRQEYYVAYAQDEWRLAPSVTMNYGLRYDMYSALSERDNRIAKFNIYTGAIDPNTTPLLKMKKNSVQPRFSMTWSPTERSVIKGGAGIFVGPGQTEDQIQPIEADRISTTVTSGTVNSFPADPAAIRLNFTGNPNNRSYQPRAYDDNYTLPEKVYQYTASFQQALPGNMAASVGYVGSQGRNLFLRSVANRIVGVQTMGAANGITIREFDILNCSNGGVVDGRVAPLTPSLCGAGHSIASIQRPYAEIDYKTSGGHDTYNSMQLSLTRRSARGLVLNGQYTLGSSRGNTGGSNEAVTAGNNARAISEFDYDNGYNNFDVRHTFNFSALYSIPGQGVFAGGWSIGGIANARSGLPVPVTIVRPDIVYVDAAGGVWNSAAADRVAAVNTPGGGASRSTRRPDLIPGVNPFVKDGGRVFLNPAAFATPQPGTFGNLERNSLHGPNFRQVDVVVSKKFGFGQGPNAELRVELFNVFNTTNFALPPAVLPNALPTGAAAAANTVQPGQAYSSSTAGTFGILASTAGTTVGLGTNRQVQLGFRLNF
jgi:hypothetical protein